MGTRGRQIIGMDVDELLRLLNAAYASEWLAYHQYWLGAKVIKGPMKDAVAAELNLHATEELNHALLLVDRIVQLGGAPVADPRKWFDLSPCRYDAPDDLIAEFIAALQTEATGKVATGDLLGEVDPGDDGVNDGSR